MAMPLAEIKIAPKEIYTYADYALLPEGAPYQLIGGKLVMTPSPIPYHQSISMRLELKLASHVLERNLGMVYDAPLDVYLEETETYQPDIIFIAKERRSIIEPTKINGAPDLVVEILSPSTAYYDLKKKFKVYAKHGVKEYWIVDPLEKSVEVYTGKDGNFTLMQRAEKEGVISSEVVKGFAVEIKDIFIEISG
ncbi:MAG TPA: restriction endonuclease [Desulfotomaculum sp.]|nr:restriction endonuclease [Desulfotomaculum sp.]